MPCVLVVGTADTKGAELAYVADVVRSRGVDVVVVDVGTSPHDTAGRRRSSRRGCRPPSRRRRGSAVRRPRRGRGGDGGRPLRLRQVTLGRRRDRRHRWLGWHGADHPGDAVAPGRRPQGDGVDGRVGQRRSVRRCRRHRHDVLDHRRRRAQPDLPGRARQRRQRRRRDGGQPGAAQRRRPACRRVDDVRRDDSVGHPARRGARRPLRPARVPRHRYGWAVDGEARRVRTDHCGARHDHDGGRRPRRRWCVPRRTGSPRRRGPDRRAVRRLVWGPRHGQLRRQVERAGAVRRPPASTSTTPRSP